jgi:phenylacetate-coenzyme A ligase PaaK-like adenylate-forming protein
LNKFSSYNDITNGLFDFNISRFESKALDIFHFQYGFNPLYRQFVNAIGTDINHIHSLADIPFIPISFFKRHEVRTTAFKEQAIFESSGTTKTNTSKHYVKDLALYTESFLKGFELFYGQPEDFCIIGLLPSYLERENSSLVVMVDTLIKGSKHPDSGFYLHDQEKLAHTLASLEKQKQQTLLIGVTFALLDFAEKYPMLLKHTTIMETGGMKGRRAELTRQEMHTILQNAFGVTHVHSEYGMTELLSQAYSKEKGIYQCPPWMKILIRDEDDPLHTYSSTVPKVTGAINVIDLANIFSCSFIATEDAGILYADESFEILGRIDNSDIRGCSLMTI